MRERIGHLTLTGRWNSTLKASSGIAVDLGRLAAGLTLDETRHRKTRQAYHRTPETQTLDAAGLITWPSP